MEVELRRCGLQNFDLGMSVKGNPDCLPREPGRATPQPPLYTVEATYLSCCSLKEPKSWGRRWKDA
jgi:hypothetical protein